MQTVTYMRKRPRGIGQILFLAALLEGAGGAFAKPIGSVPVAFVLSPVSAIRGKSSPTCNDDRRAHAPLLFGHGGEGKIDLQSDESSFGRGDMHLSAYLEEGDLVAYQTGTWFVDGVEVGDGSPAGVKFTLVDTIQIVWTHNCEHGVIRGLDVEVVGDDDEGRLVVSPSDMIEFGPEQLLARVPVRWVNEIEGQLACDTCISPVLDW